MEIHWELKIDNFKSLSLQFHCIIIFIMDKDNLNKIISLIKRTGDKIIVLNEGEPALAIMSFKDYEKLALKQDIFEKDLTKERAADKINNKEIIFQKAEQEEKTAGIIGLKPETDKTKEASFIEGYEIEPIK